MEENKKADIPVEETAEETVEVVEDAAEETVEVIDENEKKVNEAEAKAAEYLDKYQRLMADFHNFRERTTKEKANMYDDGARDTIEKLLPGIEMILKSFKEILKGLGVEEIPAVGEKFDSNVHAAVSHIDDENYGENEVTVEMLKGYMYKDKVLRHSMVQVAN